MPDEDGEVARPASVEAVEVALEGSDSRQVVYHGTFSFPDFTVLLHQQRFVCGESQYPLLHQPNAHLCPMQDGETVYAQ